MELDTIWKGETNVVDWHYQRDDYFFRVYIYNNDGNVLIRLEVRSSVTF
jgi:hypothetical protein